TSGGSSPSHSSSSWSAAGAFTSGAASSGRPGMPRSLRAGSVDADEIDDEDERLVGADHPAGAALAVGQHRRDRDPPPAADPHPLDALIPALDDLAPAELELEGAPAIPGRVELLAGLPGH